MKLVRPVHPSMHLSSKQLVEVEQEYDGKNLVSTVTYWRLEGRNLVQVNEFVSESWDDTPY